LRHRWCHWWRLWALVMPMLTVSAHNQIWLELAALFGHCGRRHSLFLLSCGSVVAAYCCATSEGPSLWGRR
jgi:hypothetical protein